VCVCVFVCVCETLTIQKLLVQTVFLMNL
jgi:hypothetical protein